MKTLVAILLASAGSGWAAFQLLHGQLEAAVAHAALVSDARNAALSLAGAQLSTAAAASALAARAMPSAAGRVDFSAAPDTNAVVPWAITACEVGTRVCATWSPAVANS